MSNNPRQITKGLGFFEIQKKTDKFVTVDSKGGKSLTTLLYSYLIEFLLFIYFISMSLTHSPLNVDDSAL